MSEAPKRKRKKAPSKKQWIEAIHGSCGIVALVAAKLGVTRKTVWRWKVKHEWVRDAFHEAEETALDKAETVIQAAIESGNPKIAAWLLERKGKPRGFGKELKIETDPSQQETYVVVLPDNGRAQEPT